MDNMEWVVVTGGAGFIGSHLVEALLDEGYRVRVVDNLATGHRSNLAHLDGRYDWLQGDVSDFEVCRRAVEGAAYVFHEAAIPSVPRSVREPLHSHASGPTATLNMLEAARAGGGPPVHVRRLQQRLRRDRGAAQARGDAPQPPEPLRRGQARRRALRARLRPDHGPGRRQPALLQRLRPAAGPVQPLQRRDLGLRSRDVRGAPAGDLRRRAAVARLHLRGQRRRRQPGRAPRGTARWRARP